MAIDTTLQDKAAAGVGSEFSAPAAGLTPGQEAAYKGVQPAFAPTAPVLSPIQRTIDTGATAAEKYLGDFTPPKSATQIAEEMRQASQGTIDSINKVYDDQVASAKSIGQERLNQDNAVSVLSGLMGSTEAGRTRGATLDKNDKEVQAINNERLAKTQAIYSQISLDARDEALKQKEDATKSAEDIIARRKDAQAKAIDNLKLLAQGGLVDFESFKNSPQNADVYQHALDSVGGSEQALRGLFAVNRPKDQLVGAPTRVGDHFIQAYQNPLTGKVAYDTIEVPGGLPPEYTSFQKIGDSTSGEYLYAIPQGWDGDQSKLKLIASTNGANSTPTGYNGEFGATVDLASNQGGTNAQRAQIKNTLQSFIANKDYPSAYAAIASATAAGLKGTAATTFQQQQNSLGVIDGLENALKAYADAGGNTNIFKGSQDQIQTKIGTLMTDPKYASLAVQLNAAFQNYRLQMTGAAFGPAESAEYASILPAAGNTLDLNLAKISGAKAYLNSSVESSIKSVVGQGGVEIKKYAEGATPQTQSSLSQPAAGYTRMIDPDGNTWDIPDANVQEAKDAGARQAFNPVGGDTQKASNRAVRNNNPLNMKASSFTSSLPGVVGTDPKPAADGGKFLTFASPEAGFNAAKKLITAPSYANLTVDAALKRWSNKGYGGELMPSVAGKKVSDLTPAELHALVQKMAHQEGYTA